MPRSNDLTSINERRFLNDRPTTRLIVAAAPGHGHMGPDLGLARFLSGSDVHVTVVLPLAADEDIPVAVRLDNSGLISVIRIEVPGDSANLVIAKAAIDNARDEVVSNIIQAGDLSQCPPSAVIYDMFASTWGCLLAETLCVPHYVFFPSPLTYAWFTQHWVESLERSASQLDDPDVFLPGIRNAIRVSDLGSTDAGAREILCQSFKSYHRANGALVHDLEDLYPRPKPLLDDIANYFVRESEAAGLAKAPSFEILSVGAVALLSPQPPLKSGKSAELEWLDSQPQRSVVFVALGSWCQLSIKDTIELARGLQLCEKPILWAYRATQHSAVTEETEDVDSTGLPLGFRHAVEDRAFIAPWVDQPAVLRHPAIGCFLTHCGWNSVMEALSFAGVPMSLLPIGAEQGINANVLDQEWKCGKRLWDMQKNRSLHRERVAAVIKECAADETIWRNTQSRKAALNEAAESNGRVTTSRNRFLDSISRR